MPARGERDHHRTCRRQPTSAPARCALATPTPGCLLILLAWLCSAVAATAQISPGLLSTAHQQLEGSGRCLDCHRPGKGVDANLCLSCHRGLAARVSSDQGLHARPDHARCERCHAEHNGRSFALVYWGEAGAEGFDHALTGHTLAGAHRAVACRNCHRPDRVPAPLRDPTAGVAIERTFLGLSTACASCHRDPHAGRLGSSCANCHGETAWRPAAGFAHDATRYPLTERHRDLACPQCHTATPATPDTPAKAASLAPAPAAVTTEAGRFTEFADRPLPDCASCHRDPHAGRLGTSCASCHDTAAFTPARRDRFDHDRTSYLLLGRHRSLACESCHRRGQPYRIPAANRCETCHRDPHGGQLSTARGAGDGTGCASCHRVSGFVPALYGPEQHAQSRFPLHDAHLATPCPACHREGLASRPTVPPAGGTSGGRPGSRTTFPLARAQSASPGIFAFGSFACADCHRDPHQGTLARYVDERGCATCHDEVSFRQVRFDHQASNFPLLGKHRTVACADCHRRPEVDSEANPGRDSLPPVLTGTPTECALCHLDPHRGQLQGTKRPVEANTTRGPPTAVADLAASTLPRCASCHSAEGFVPAAFDHQTDSAWPLDGAHQRVACAACHPTEVDDRGSFVRYKPLPTDCAGCHAAGRTPSPAQGRIAPASEPE